MFDSNMTPAERAAKMNSMPTHVVYMTRGGGRAMITQSYAEVIADTDVALTIQSVTGVLDIPKSDVYAAKDGRLTADEMDAIFAEHGSKQAR